MMSKEETHNGIDNNSSGEGGLSEDNLKLNDSQGEALISNESGSRSELSIKHDSDDKLSNDRRDSIQAGDREASNRSDKEDSTENTLKTECQPDSEESETRITNDSGDSDVKERDPVQDLSPSDRNDDTVSAGKVHSDSKGENNGTVTGNDNLNQNDPEARSSGENDENVNSVDKEKDSGSLNLDSERAEKTETFSRNEGSEDNLNKKETSENVRRKSTDTIKSASSNPNETTKIQHEEFVENVDDILKEKDTSGETFRNKTDDSDGKEEYDDDFEDDGDVETENVDNAVNDQNRSPNEKKESQSNAVENGKSNEVTSPAEDNGNKTEEGEKEEQYEDDFEVTEPGNENPDTEDTEKEVRPDGKGESPASSGDSGGNDRITTPVEESNLEPNEEVTKVVVNDDGIPKVLVTTVPDRPPSSQASDTEGNDNSENNASREIKEDENETGIENETLNNHEVNTHDEESKPAKLTDEKPDQSIKHTEEGVESDSKTDSGVDRTNTENEVTKEMTNETVRNTDSNEVVSKEPEESNDIDRRESNGSVAKTKFPGDIVSERTEAEDNKRDTMTNKDVKGDDIAAVSDTDLTKSDNKELDKGDDHTNQSAEKEVEKKTEIEKDQKPTGSEAKNDEEKDPKPVEPELKKIESPLDKLLQRHVEIDGTVESITDLEQNVLKLLTSMKDVMAHYKERLKLQTLKDITDDMGKFRGDFQSVNDAFKAYSNMTININHKLKDLRHVTEDVKTQISRKFISEDLSTWVDQTPEQEKGEFSLLLDLPLIMYLCGTMV